MRHASFRREEGRLLRFAVHGIVTLSYSQLPGSNHKDVWSSMPPQPRLPEGMAMCSVDIKE